MEISDILGVGKAICKLIDTVENAVGWCFAPVQKRRLAKAEADRISILSKAMSENIQLPSKYERNGLVIDTSDYKEIIERCNHRNLYQEYIKEINIESIVGKTAEILEKKDNVSEEPVDRTWANVYFDSAGYISDLELQELWAKLLAAEIEMPGQTSMRTLEIIRTMSSEEVRLFDKLAEYILNMEDDKNGVIDYFLLLIPPFFQYSGVTFPDILKLVDARILMNTGNDVSVGANLEKGKTKNVYAGDEIAFVLKNATDKNVEVFRPAALLTEAGREVYVLLYKHGHHINGKEEYYISCRDYFLNGNV